MTTSPVPGGMSMMRSSRGPHSTWQWRRCHLYYYYFKLIKGKTRKIKAGISSLMVDTEILDGALRYMKGGIGMSIELIFFLNLILYNSLYLSKYYIPHN